MRTMGVGTVLLIIAVICFALAALRLEVAVNLVALGLTFFAASFLVGDAGWGRP